MAAWSARQAGQYEAAEAKAFARTIAVTWGWRQSNALTPLGLAVGSGQQR
jgi:hypothetical protein